MTAGHVPGDPRGFAPVGPAEHRPGPSTVLVDGTPVLEHRFLVPIDHALTLEQARVQDADGTGVGPGGRGTLEVLARPAGGLGVTVRLPAPAVRAGSET